MRKIITCIVTGSLALLPFSTTSAQDENEEGAQIVPVELYICNYHEGQGPADLGGWAEKWNAWVDSGDAVAYSAYTMTPFYFGEDQDFDFIWLGFSPDAATLGRAYDRYLSESGSLPAEFNAIAHCGSHSNFATMNIKEPPDDDATSFVLSFSDCKHAEGKKWEDVEPALSAWSEYTTANGSQAGMWVMWPAYGGGAVDYDFKLVVSHRSHESLGVDYDQYSSGGYAKAEELFSGVVDCDVSRSYSATERRDGMPDDD